MSTVAHFYSIMGLAEAPCAASGAFELMNDNGWGSVPGLANSWASQQRKIFPLGRGAGEKPRRDA